MSRFDSGEGYRSAGGQAQSKSMLQVLDGLPIPLLVVNQSEEILFVNRDGRDLFEVPDHDSSPKHLAQKPWTLLDTEGNPVSISSLVSAAVSKDQIQTHELLIQSARGLRHLKVSTRRLPSVFGAKLSAIITFQDVTEIKVATLELDRALRSRDEFLSIATHELKTPLTSLQLQLQLLHRNLKKSAEPMIHIAQLEERLIPSLRQLDRMSEMLQRLLDLSRIRNDRLHLDISAVDLCELVKDVVHRFSSVASASGTVIDLAACRSAIAYIDSLRIEQVLANLLSNALKYGSGKPIWIAVYDDEEWASIEVQDCGIGIPKESQTRIFNRFERATQERNQESLGLGLFICSQIVAAHGGKIELESEVGKGSKFTIRLPLKKFHSGAGFSEGSD